ncbi:MAG: phytanoyl-CoA dioxygenase family protein [Anaerolineae bacterium]|nr:phytanoyl-CoA dioxygenase family protein [Anaerolineae bacterium]NUQ03669.1 phytanoyl-CoA dioxygenase family protein [Anaerolineae bacterium]
MQPYQVTQQDVDFYQQYGYWISPKIFSDEEVEQFRTHHARVVAGDYETGQPPFDRNIPAGAPVDRLVKIDNSHWSDSTISRLVTHPAIGAMAARLADVEGIRLWHDQLLHKPPQSETAIGAVGWHQDYHYWQCATPPDLLTAWIALVDVDENNGCMEVVPESHHWGLLPDSDFFEQDLDTLKARIERASGRPFTTVPCVLPKGAMSFHHCLTVHGSRPNRSAAARVSMVAHLMPDGTRYKSGTPAEPHMNVRFLSGQDGDDFAGPYFPLLYREGQADNTWKASI